MPATASSNLLPPTQQGIERAAEFLRQNRLVILPTETVYGIAVNLLSADARQAVARLKRKWAPNAAPPQWVLHVGQPEDVLAWAGHVSSLGRRLIIKSLPGPVAFQIKLAPGDLATANEKLGSAAQETLPDGFLNIRCPDLSITQQVLSQAKAPIAIIGAGTPARPAIFELSDLPEGLIGGEGDGDGGGVVKAALDGGPTRYRKSSTLVRIDGDHYSVIRPGVIDERIIHKLADFTILFLCSGNTCRSPMAAAIAARILADKMGIEPNELPLRHIVVQSAGLHATKGMRAATDAMQAVKEYRADLSSHLSQPATVDLLRRADVIYTMTDSHLEEVLAMLPSAENKAFRLDPEGDVADPIGSGSEVYQRVADQLSTVLVGRLSGLAI